MATKYMKLGFENRVINEERFFNLTLNNKKVGVNIGIALNYYRGLHLSCLQELKVKIDNQEIPSYLILFNLNGKKFNLNELKDMHQEYWGIKEIANLQIFNNGLEEGEHNIEIEMYLKTPYMQFAPGIYGAISSSAQKNLVLKEARELC